MRKWMKKAGLFLSGALLLGIGIGICNAAGWGVDPLAVFTSGVSKTMHISFSNANSMIYFIMAVLAAVMDRRQVTVWTFFSPFVTSLGIAAAMRVVPGMAPTVFSFVCYLTGIVIMAVGIALSIEANIGKAPYDALIFALMGYTKKKYAVIRWPMDGMWLGIGFLLGGVWGIGTVLTLAIIGKLIEAVQKIIRKQTVPAS